MTAIEQTALLMTIIGMSGSIMSAVGSFYLLKWGRRAYFRVKLWRARRRLMFG